MPKPPGKILIVVPPFASVDFPMIGPSLLVAGCHKENLSANVKYANLRLAQRIGFTLYEKISLSSFALMPGELLFKDLAFPGTFPQSRQAIKSYFEENESLNVSSLQLDNITIDELLHCTELIEQGLEEIVQDILADAPSIVGISSTFQQNLPSIAIARAIKNKSPQTIVVLGGANASSPMGTELAACINVFDYIFSGEADFEFPAFAKNYLHAGKLPESKIIECAPVQNMDEIAYPDYSDYFQELQKLKEHGLTSYIPGKLPIETSRGCWWGAKKHCTFCGLNGKEISFRNKSAARIMYEIDSLSSTYNLFSFQATDNIMPLTFKKQVLPLLSKVSPKKEFFYEVKSNLKEDELDLFCTAGVNSIQPGIESFSSNILQLIDKGVKGIQNLWLLRECLSRQIQVVWNILVAVPQDTIADYKSTLDLIPKIQHFHPPQAVSKILIDRYSPYHSFPEKYGIKNITPLKAYSLLYPEFVNLHNIAYHFTASFNSEYAADPCFAAQFNHAVESQWINKWTGTDVPPKLYTVPMDDERYFIEDTRSCAINQREVLDAVTTSLLLSLRTPTKNIESTQLNALQFLIERGFVINHEGYWLSIVAEPQIGFNLRTHGQEKPLQLQQS